MSKLKSVLVVAVVISLQVTAVADAPPLPQGLAEDLSFTESVDLPANNTGVFTGFWEFRLGSRLQDDPVEDRISLAETRLQLGYDQIGETIGLRMIADLVYDAQADDYGLDLETGAGWLDLREMNGLFRVNDYLDIKLGRQILTWGTGDLVFINDLFPKDFQSFFLGRNEEYLKAPSDAVKFSLYNEVANIDLVYTPRFDADRYIDGSRLSFYNATLGQLTGKDTILHTERPDVWFADDEIALRVHRNLVGYELAAYAYNGYWKSPAGHNPLSSQAIFPRLNVYGLSIRGVAGGGIGYSEVGYYDSRDDLDGNDPYIRNSELRILFGYEWEIIKNLKGGIQYYLEHMMDHDDYRKSLPVESIPVNENRHLLTFRVTRLALRNDLRLSLFTFYSLSDEDGYLKPLAIYQLTDDLTIEAGANWFFGKHQHSFFGQFENNSNLFASVRYSFGAGI